MLYTMCMLCKSMLAALPALLLVLDFWPLGRMKISSHWREAQSVPGVRTSAMPSGRLLMEKVLLLLPAAAVAGVSALGLKRYGVVVGDERTIRIENAFVSWGRYVGRLLWPGDLALWYPLPAPSVWLAAAAAVGVLLVTVLTLRQGRSRPWLATGWLWYLLGSVPIIVVPMVAWRRGTATFRRLGC